MEKLSSKAIYPPFSLVGLVGIFLFHRILNWVVRIHKFYSSFQSFLHSLFDSHFDVWAKEKTCSNSELLRSQDSCFHGNKGGDDGKLCRRDVEKVMERLGIYCNNNPEDDKIQESLGSDELSTLFADKEPSLEEVKEAFDVFDANGDGFIDASELQRVLRNLGFMEGSQVEECKRMIAAFDENGDGKLDFNEFVKFMKQSFN